MIKQAGRRVDSQPRNLLAGIHARESGQERFSRRHRSQPAETSEARQQAMSALAMSKAAATLPLLEQMYETMPSRELKRRALYGIARSDNRDGAATYSDWYCRE